MTLRELYELVTTSTIAPDHEVEVIDGELLEVRPPRPALPPAPEDPDSPDFIIPVNTLA